MSDRSFLIVLLKPTNHFVILCLKSLFVAELSLSRSLQLLISLIKPLNIVVKSRNYFHDLKNVKKIMNLHKIHELKKIIFSIYHV